MDAAIVVVSVVRIGNVAGTPADDEHYGEDYQQDVYEIALLALGGPALLRDAHEEAGSHVDRHHPWDGHGPEPAERVAAYLAAAGRDPARRAATASAR